LQGEGGCRDFCSLPVIPVGMIFGMTSIGFYSKNREIDIIMKVIKDERVHV
jgi:hypothetical protein